MPLQQTSGNVTQDAYGGGTAVAPIYIEDVMSTFLYTGNGSTQTITNGINLSSNGGLVWTKDRTNGLNHALYDTVRGAGSELATNTTNAASSESGFAFLSTGYSFGARSVLNYNGGNYVSWTFRKQPKFFDVVTWTGDSTTRAIPHNLGAVPGCIIVKRTNFANDWAVYHRATSATPWDDVGFLNSTSAWYIGGNPSFWGSTAPTATDFTVGTSSNSSGSTYVAYLFAHNAGGFGLTGTDNVISCGSFTTSGGGGDATVDLGYEPQWLLVKSASGVSGWDLMDNMRGMPNYGTYGSATALEANNSNAEGSRNPNCYPTATGFYYARAASTTYIYIAIRRGPMKVPTDGTKVFTPATRTGTGTATTITSAGFPVDLVIGNSRNAVSYGSTGAFGDRLRGKQNLLYSPFTSAEDTANVSITGFDVQNGISVGDTNAYSFNYSGGSYVNWFFRRAPGFFDEVCYTGNGNFNTSGTVYNVTHNLTVRPELVIIKARGSATNWPTAVAISSTQWVAGATTGFALNTTAEIGSTYNFSTLSYGTAAAFYPAVVGEGYSGTNNSGATYVAYLFATCPGVSKVGSYTGTGATQTISCGFTGGARFVLVKRTDSTGDWYVWDTARGMVSGTDPSLLLNSTAAEVNANSIYTATGGFQIVSTAAGINASGGTYIYLSIA